MNSPISIWKNIALFVCLMASLTISAFAQQPLEQKELLSKLPASTTFIFHTTNIKSVADAIAKSPVGSRLDSEPWTKLRLIHKQKNVGSLLHTAPWLGMEWTDLQLVDQEGFLVGFRDSNNKPSIMLLLSLGSQAKEHLFVKRWFATFGDGTELKPQSIDHQVNLYTSVSKDSKSLQSCLVIGPTWSCVSSSPTAVQNWLTSNTPASFSLTDLASRSLTTSTTKKALVSFWLKPSEVIADYTQEAEPKLFKSMSRYGLDSLLEFAGSLLIDETLEHWQIDYQLSLKQPLEKGLAILNFKKGEDSPLPPLLKIAAQNDLLDNQSVAHIDIKPWFQGVNYLADLMIDEETPGGFADILDSLLTDPEGPQVDVRQEIIYQLGDTMFLSGTTLPHPKKTNQFQRHSLSAFAYPSREKISATLHRMFDSDDEVTSEQIGNTEIFYTVSNESLFISLSESDTQTITAAAVDDSYIYLSTSSSWLKKLASQSDNQSSEPPEAATSSNKPSSGELSFKQTFDLTNWLHVSWLRVPERTPQRKDYDSTDIPALIITNTLVPSIDAADLPKWDLVKGLFGRYEATGIRTDNGLQGTIHLKFSADPKK